MLIDWFTVGAQVVNFVILVWLLQHFLYRPILDAIDNRERQIARMIADADATRTEAQHSRELFMQKSAQFDQQRAGLLANAEKEAEAERQRLVDEAQKAAGALAARRQHVLLNDARNLHVTVAQRAQQEVFTIARKALADLAATSLEERLVEVFTRRLRAMDDKTKSGLALALRSASTSALVRSAFELPAEQRATILNSINETFSADIQLRFEAAPDLISGIELSANGTKVAWNIADYLAELEKDVSALLKERCQTAQSALGEKIDERPT